MSVTVQRRGGLGNQLFQYAAGLSSSRKLGSPLLLDTALLPLGEVSLGGVRRWTEQLSAFHHSGSFIDSSRESAPRKRFLQSAAGWERRLGDSPIGFLRGGHVYAHEVRDDTGELSKMTGDVRINSYCFSPDFFPELTDELATQLKNLVHPSDWYRETREDMARSQPIALHVRWGDFLNLKHIYGSLSADYYRRGIDLVVAQGSENRPIWLFSDDPSGAADFLSDHVDVERIVEPSSDSSALENLLLLSEASALVCANSSFSWWAAYISRSARGIVFPRPLFARTGPPEPKNWLTPEWIQIGAQ